MYSAENSKQIFPEKELCGLSPNFHIQVSVNGLYIPTIGLPILLQDQSWEYIKGRRPQAGKHLPQSSFTGQYFQIVTFDIAFYQSKSFNDSNIRPPTAVEIGKAVLCHDKYQPTCTFMSYRYRRRPWRPGWRGGSGPGGRKWAGWWCRWALGRRF